VLVLLSLLPAVPAMSHAGVTTSPHRPVRDRGTPPPVVVSVRDSGFQSADAGVGAAATLAATFLGSSPNSSNTRARKERS
jgi:hypothetical protein